MPMAIKGWLIDLDGTVYTAAGPVPGAGDAIEAIRARGVGVLFTTNTSRKSRRDVVADLVRLGLSVQEEEVFSAPVAAAGWLRTCGHDRIDLLLPESTHADFTGFKLTHHEPDAVLVGDLGAEFTFERLNEAFRNLRGGAELVALHRNRYWLPAAGPTLDAGPFVAALEYASGREAVLVGKPAPAFFATAAERLGLLPEELAVVGDDLESDIRGGRVAGLTTVLVETGKSTAAEAARMASGYEPQHVIPSLRELPSLLE